MSSSRRKGQQSGDKDILPDDQDDSMHSSSSELDQNTFKDKIRQRVHDYTRQQQHGTALYWANKLINNLSQEPNLSVDSDAEQEEKDRDWDTEDKILLAEVLINKGEYRRAAQRLTSSQLEKSNLQACYLAAKALIEAKQPEEALEIIDKGVDLVQTARSSLEEVIDLNQKKNLRQRLSSVYLLKGKILEALDNRKLAADSYCNALNIDLYCSEAFEILIQHQMLSLREEEKLLKDLKSSVGQCEDPENAKIALGMYEIQTKKYSNPADFELSPQLEIFSNDMFVLICKAERYFYNSDYYECYTLTSRVLKEDTFNTDCLPIHISCLVELNRPTELFPLAQNLVSLYPEWTVAWFAVGCYYYLIGKQDEARQNLKKATVLDRVFGPAWLAYGHSFAQDNEHDQAMAAYFKACQLMSGCHLPLLYIGVEYGLTNNLPLAEKFFKHSLEIAPDDPFVAHELGVINFQNSRFSEAEFFFLKAWNEISRIKDSILLSKWEALLNNLGHAYRKLKKFDTALEYHQKALVLVPTCASTYSAIGFVYALKQDFDKSIEAFHKALGIRSDDAFSTTMLNKVIEQFVNDEPPYPGCDDEAPKLTPLKPEGASAFS